MTSDLPTGWAEVSLADVCTGVPQRGPRPESETFTYIDLGAIDNKAKCVADPSTVVTASAPSRAKQCVAAGDVLFSTVRVYLENIARVPSELEGAIASTAFTVLRPKAAIDSGYLYRLATSKPFIQAVNALQRGNSPPSVQDGDVRSQRIPLPPLGEQQRIVSRIEELFSEIDEGERALQRVGRLVERYRQSVLKAAVTGELTREWREQQRTGREDAGVLLRRVGEARRAASIEAGQRCVEPCGADGSGLGALPPGWLWVTVEQLCFVETGATPKRGEAKYYGEGTIPWVTSGAVNAARITEPTELITECAVAETNAKVFPVGTLVVAMYGEGKTRGKVSELGIAAATNQACAALLCAHMDEQVKSYVRLFFEKHYEELRNKAAGGVQPNLNLSIIKQTALPLPPLAELQVVCDRVATRLSEVNALGTEVLQRSPAVKALRQSVLKAAFSGQLVPQDPSDEPAAALLARLAAQAAGAPIAPKRGGRPRRQPATT